MHERPDVATIARSRMIASPPATRSKPRRWQVAPPHDGAADLARALGVSVVTAQLLINRGHADADAARAFLAPTLKNLIDPAKLPGIAPAIDRLLSAIKAKEPIVIYGDYDVDGITASAILWHSIRALGGDVRCYVPHRIEEGYGLNVEAIRQLCDEGARLIVTVDCGVTAVAPVAHARERGVDLIVTDHHEWKVGESEDASAGFPFLLSPSGFPLLPAATAIVHPRLGDYANPHLCGAGVAFKLAWGVGQAMGFGGRVPEAMKHLLVEMTALAALGTIADVVPLVGENRVLARFGLGGLKASKLNGIRALIAACGLDDQKLDSFHVGFLLGPRLNAAGRMGHARLAVEMLTDASPARAAEIATYLESQNKLRQATEREIVRTAIEQADRLGMGGDDCHAVVVGSAGWHAGVIGIVASRLVERFGKPALVIALGDDGHAHGSGRSVAGFHLARALDACKAHLKTCGGHEMAAGLSLRCECLDDFRAAFLDYARLNLAPELLVPTLRVDVVAELAHVSHALVDEFDRLGPFGNGNPKPLIAVRGATVTQAKKVGKTGDHLQVFVKQNGRLMKGIAFGLGAMAVELPIGTTIDLAIEPQLNEWNGQVNVEMMVKDIAIAE